MKSIIDLKTSIQELESSNQGIVNSKHDQITPSRDVTFNNFTQGSIYLRWDIGSSKYWLPSKSYLRFRCKLTGSDGVTPVKLSDGIAPCMNVAANFFQSLELRLNDQVISRCSDYVAQVDTLEKRLAMSKSWLDSVGASSSFFQSSFDERQAQVCSNGYLADKFTQYPEQKISSRVDMGFDAADGGAADRNAAAYDATTGIISFTQNGGGALPANPFAVGDLFVYNSVQGGSVSEDVEMQVLEVLTGNRIRVANNAAASVLVDGRTDFQKVQRASNNNVSVQAGEFEVVWQPHCLSAWKLDHAMPTGRYELVCNPNTEQSFQKRVVQSLEGNKNPIIGNSAGDYKLSIVDMYMYLYTFHSDRIENLTYYLDLHETSCQGDKILSADLQQRTFDIQPSTVAATTAYQDTRVGTDTRASATLFKSYDTNYTDTRNGTISQELGIQRYYQSYAGRQLPTPDSDSSFIRGKNSFIQRYVESLLENGSYFDSGGPESFKDYIDRGYIVYFNHARDPSDRSTRLINNQQFKPGTDVTNMRVLQFAHYRAVCKVQIERGMVTSVERQEI